MPVYEFIGDHTDFYFKVTYPLTFGSWALDPEVLALKHNKYYWEIDLERCNTSAEILDWIFHMRGKANWTGQDTLDLVAAFEAILSPMRNFCTRGMVGAKGKEPEGGAKAIVEKYLRKES